MNKSYKIKYYRLVNSSTSTAVLLSTALASGVGTFFDKVMIQALQGNSDLVGVGDAPVMTSGSESGFILEKGASIHFDNVDLADLKLLPTVGGEGVMIGVYTVKTF